MKLHKNQVIDETLRMSLVNSIVSALAQRVNLGGERQPGQLTPDDAVRLTYRMVDLIERAEEERQRAKDVAMVENAVQIISAMLDQPREHRNIPMVIAKLAPGLTGSRDPDVVTMAKDIADALSERGKPLTAAEITPEVARRVVEALQDGLERLKAN